MGPVRRREDVDPRQLRMASIGSARSCWPRKFPESAGPRACRQQHGLRAVRRPAAEPPALAPPNAKPEQPDPACRVLNQLPIGNRPEYEEIADHVSMVAEQSRSCAIAILDVTVMWADLRCTVRAHTDEAMHLHIRVDYRLGFG